MRARPGDEASPATGHAPSATRRHTAVAAGVGLLVGLLALGPALAPGFTLAYDMVFVPHPVFTKATFGLTGMLPRHVPSDAVVTALGQIVPADVVQKIILLGIFVMACVSAASLVPGPRLSPRLAAGVLYAWNPFVAERLLLGQWALLLGYAALPWVARAAASGETLRLLLALVPAAIGGFAATAVSALTALPISVQQRGSWPKTSAALITASLPWLTIGLLRSGTVPADPAGVAAFAARADTPFGAIGSLLLLGGTWNAETVPAGYGEPLTVLPWLCLVAVAVAAYLVAARSRTTPVPGLGAAAVLGTLIAVLGVLAPGLLRGGIRLWPGFAVLRDGQQFVAPLAVVVALGAGLAVARIRLAPVRAVAVALPIAVLPGLAWGAAGRLTAVPYPADWDRARAVVAADPGDVLVLPWEAYRSYPWNGGRRVLDPLPRHLPTRVILNDAVRVRERGGRVIALAVEDPRARALDPLVRSGAPLTAALGARGVRYVVVDVADRAENAAVEARLSGAVRVVDGPDMRLYRIPEFRGGSGS